MKKLALIGAAFMLFGCGDKQASISEREKSKSDSIKTVALADSIAAAFLSSTDNEVIIKVDSFRPTKNIKEKRDDFKGVVFYTHKNDAKGWKKDIKLYVVKDNEGGDYFARIRVEYSADDWLFMRQAIFLCDGKKHVLNLEDCERDNDSGEIYEYCDMPVTGKIKEVLQAIVNAKDVQMRYNGDQYYSERKLSSSEISRLKEMYLCIFGQNSKGH